MTTFDDTQRSYYLREFDTTSTTSDTSVLQSALGINVPSVVSSGNAQKLDAACRALPYPGTSMRDPDARTGCGWWHTPVSVGGGGGIGAYGTRRGPMNIHLEKQIGPGRWIWDPQEAYRLEGLSRSSTIKTCKDLSLTKFPNIGWCPSTNAAVLTDRNGYPAFPQDAGGDCPGPIIMSAGSCPTDDAGPVAAVGVTTLCTPDKSGALSPACLQSLTNMGGCPGGTLFQAFANGGYANTSDSFNAANRVLQERGFTIHPGIVNDGKLSIDSMWSSLNGLKAITVDQPGLSGKEQSAALNLCYGTPFDPCALSASDKGPFDPLCITQTAREMGYGSNAKLLPESIGMDYWNNFPSWGDIVGNLMGWKTTADSSSSAPKAQTDAIQKVYGVNVQYPKYGCNVVGMFMYRYFSPKWDTTLFPSKGSNAHYLGRYILKNGFPQQGSTTQERTPAGGFVSEGQRMITSFVPLEGGSYQFLISCEDYCRLQVDGTVIAEVGCCGVPTPSRIISFIAKRPYTIIADVWNSGGSWSFMIRYSKDGSPWAPIPPTQLFMPQDRRLPMIDITMNKLGSGLTGPTPITDSPGVLQNWLLSSAASIGVLNGRTCLLVSGAGSNVNNRASFIQGIRLRSIKSLTLMVHISSVSIPVKGVCPSLVSFNNLPSTNITGYPAVGSNGSRSYAYHERTDDFMICPDPEFVFPWGIQNGSQQVYMDVKFKSQMSYPTGQWFHLAYVWDDGGGATIFINGKQGSHLSLKLFDVSKIMENICIGCDSHPDGQFWTGGIAWCRFFDYPLNTDHITLDMNDGWNSL